MALGLALGIAGGIVVSLFAAWHGMSYYFVDKKCERPKFDLIRTVGQRKKWLGLRTVPAVEIRRYAPMLIAEVIIEQNDMRRAMNTGFRQVAEFIFGKNLAQNKQSQKVQMTAPVTMQINQPKNQKIQMTAPVTSQFLEQSKYKIAFVMPSQYTKETLPKPINQNVKIKEIRAHTMGAMGWNGSSPNKQQTTEKQQQLRDYLQKEGIKTIGNIHLYQYHPPFSPPWMRLNEVLLEIDE